MTALTTIWRFDAMVDDLITLRMPKRARILSVATSDRVHHGIAVWALVEPAADQETRHLYVRGTGHPLTHALGRFVGSCIDGQFVWHVFEPAPIVGSDPGPPHDSDGPE